MILYPAIDLKDGRVVRLRRGAMDSATVFNADPAAQAADFAAAGFEWLHIVDLDGAIAGRAVNRDAVHAILQAVKIPLQLGGGVRDLAAVEAWLAAGAARVILGTAAVKTPELVSEACRRFPGRVAVGIDARAGRVAVEGWAEASEATAADVARRFEDDGVAAIIYTDIERDGMLAGINLAATLALAEAVATPVIASGGIAGLDDIAGLLAVADRGITGAICGRAFYDGSIDPKSAIELVKGGRAAAC